MPRGRPRRRGFDLVRIDDDGEWDALPGSRGAFESASMRGEEFATVLYTSGSRGPVRKAFR